MNFKKVNNYTGWAIGIIASAVYILTREATGSFWDCGEFVSSAYKIQNPHPPGAPLFVLLGRFFIILFGNNPDSAARAVNLMSALASGMTIMFLFWTITHFARKIYVKVGENLTSQQILTVMGAGVIGSLIYTFSDSFWFSAVEGEVYAMSSFFTGFVFWAMLKWEHADEHAGNDQGAKNRADRWIVFIFFMMGLSIGVHLLVLLTIPAVVMIYYFRRYTPTVKGGILAFIIGCALTGIVQLFVIQYSIKYAGKFDILFVNDFGLPFFSGFIFFFVLLGFLIWLGIKIANKRDWAFLRLGLWCLTFMMLGYSTYVTSLIRSNANPAIDMNNVDNPINLVYWLSREQYGDAPLVYGPHFMADYEYGPDGYVVMKEGEMKYVKGKDKYIEIGREQDPTYDSKDMQLFPRVWDRTDDQDHARFYAQWLNLQPYQDQRTGQIKYDAPSYGDNLNWFVTYQNGLMYWRYFMWNFAGKQNDIQGYGNKRDGNWITGIPLIDNSMLGDQAKLPDSIKNNKAHNTLFLLPFILGIIGCVYQFIKNKKDWIVTFLLFFFTGLAIVIYLNQPGNQPRERDYAFAGSFYAYAIWAGLAVAALVKLAREKADKLSFTNTLTFGAVLTFVICLLSYSYGSGKSALVESVMITAVYVIVTVALTYLLRALSSNEKTLSIVTSVVCLIAPLVMAQQEWDDHDRSKKTLARDIAKDYLESCAPNAILFTFGDNDTYPLWYAQEVEGVRPDIRIINNSLLGIDWYINQLRYKINESGPVDVLWGPDQIEGHKREYLRYNPEGANKEKFYPLDGVMKLIGQGDDASTFPTKRFTVPVDTALVRKNGTVNPTDSVLSSIQIDLGDKNTLLRNELIILNIIAANHWERPIYFTSPYGELGFGQYIRKDGISYRLAPVVNKFPQINWVVDQAIREESQKRRIGLGGTSIRDDNTDFMYNNLMTKFAFGGANRRGVYFDEENRRHLLNLRATYGELAGEMADNGNKEKAKKLIDLAEAEISTDNLPYAMVSRFGSHNETALIYLEGCYKAGKIDVAEKVRRDIEKDILQERAYMDYQRSSDLNDNKSFTLEYEINEIMYVALKAIEKKYAPQTQATNKVEINGGQISTQSVNKDSLKKDSAK